jgi:8-oxo-dGTP pyrophosphatase MutT (NUDIX family)
MSCWSSRKLGSWLYPGGHIDPNDDPAQAVLREVTEETGITFRITESRFRFPAATALPAPFTIRVRDIPADATSGSPALIEKQPNTLA